MDMPGKFTKIAAYILSPFLDGYWISPSGEVFGFPGTSEHYYWVMHNMDMLNQRMGTDLTNATQMQILLRESGWIRIRITTDTIMVQGKDRRLIRDFLDDFAVKISPDDLDQIKVYHDDDQGGHSNSVLSDWL